VHGPVNLTAPHPVTNAEFTAELGRVLHRPTPWVIPSPALHAVLDGFAEEVVTGQRAVPAVLTAAGFTFLHRDLGTALRAWTG
jgi:NAD dependent epimerase/dehydratase family enzyme